MFDILRKSLATGVVTTPYPLTAAEVSPQARGRPEIDFVKWKDARPAAAICPTGAISYEDRGHKRTAKLDLAKCIFCGLCAEVDQAIRMTTVCECAARHRDELITSAGYQLNPAGTHERLMWCEALDAFRRPIQQSGAGFQPADVQTPGAGFQPADQPRRPIKTGDVPRIGPSASAPPASSRSPARPLAVLDSADQIKGRVEKVLGRSLHIREVDAGSCNGCEIEIVGLNSPVYDLERFGIHFVASPRHADMLLVTGPVTRNMELALKKTYDAMPDPRLVVAVGVCGCSGGIFGQNYATVGAVDAVIPVDVYIPGCPPNPHALLQGILTAIGSLE